MALIISKNNFVIRPIIKALTGTGFDKRKYEEMIATWNYAGISEAFMNDEIDFSIRSGKFQYLYDNCWFSLCQRYWNYEKIFQIWCNWKLVQNGSITYHDLVAKAVNRENSLLQTCSLISSSTSINRNSIRQIIRLNPVNPLPRWLKFMIRKIVKLYKSKLPHFDCKRLNPNRIERFNYYRKIFLVLRGTEEIPVLPYWKAELKNINIRDVRQLLFVKFYSAVIKICNIKIPGGHNWHTIKINLCIAHLSIYILQFIIHMAEYGWYTIKRFGKKFHPCTIYEFH